MTTDTDAVKPLLPCPFCGCSIYSNDIATLEVKRHTIKCPDCPCRMEYFSSTKAEAINAWNRRSTTAEQADAARNEERYQWLRRRAVMVDYSDETVTTLTLFKDEGPTGEFLDDWVDGQIAAPSTGNPT